jgi:hypothetical protein
MKKLTAQEWLDVELTVNEDCESCRQLAKQVAMLSLIVKAVAGKAPDSVRGEKVKA